MKNVEELIALGKVPSDTVGANQVAGYPDGWPIFTDIANQVKFDWDNLPSDRVRGLKANAAYKTALDAFLLAPAEKVTPAPPEGQVQSLALSPEEALEQANETPTTVETPVVETAPVVEAPVVATTEIPVGSVVDGFTKTSTGWEIKIEIEGAGTQIFRGKTMGEVAQALAKAQVNASLLIRRQQQEREQMLLNEPADIRVDRKVLKPRKLTAEEQFEFAEAMSSGDAVKINKAMAKRDSIIMGGEPEEVIAQVTEHQSQLELETYKATAKQFIKQNSDVIMSKELGDAIDEILLSRNWAYTVRNMNKALAELKAENKVELKVSTPADEVELPIPTSAVAAAPVVVTPPPAPPAAVPVVPKPPVLTDGERLRPGSASTGMSPRQASVRQGAGAPVTKAVGLTAEEYNRMSVSETKRKYHADLGFRAAVDKLIADGKI